MNVADFISRWQRSGASERANKDSYLKELCRVLGVPEPDAKTGDPDLDTYVFEADARILSEEDKPRFGSMDLYYKGHFVLEAKQGSDAGSARVGTAKRGTAGWASAMNDAYGQALRYARTLEEPPPFVIVADLGYCFDLYACFDGSGAYRPFPNAQKNRLRHADLASHLDLLRSIWVDPYSRDPSRRATRVTTEIAQELAELATQLEVQHEPEVVSKFLMRCVFTMFAEDIGLLQDRAFSKCIEKVWLSRPSSFKEGVESLWRAMNTGDTFYVLGKLLRFNGGLFANPVGLALSEPQIKVLHSAASRDWAEVEPAIFGSLIEWALSPTERHKLGAHFTPTDYVKRLLTATIEEPIRSDWDAVRDAVRKLVPPGEVAKPAKVEKAIELVDEFRQKLCTTTVLDPACGSGNFLYIALHLLKEIESEVRSVLYDLGAAQQPLGEDVTVTPRQFLGLETRSGSRDIADLVLWIGYLQWHHKMYGGQKIPPEPILRDFGNIECRDALIDSSTPPLGQLHLDAATKPRTAEGPTRAQWPTAQFIVGNPPFVGNKRMRAVLGDGYVETLRSLHADVPASADLVMYWWHEAAKKVRAGETRAFGLITTNSITQFYNRAVVAAHLANESGGALSFAVPDHPWVDSESGASVRIAMTVGVSKRGGVGIGTLLTVKDEHDLADSTEGQIGYRARRGIINSDLTIGADVTSAPPLTANAGLCQQGVKLVGSGFSIDESTVARLGGHDGKIVKPLLSNKDVVRKHRHRSTIDFDGCKTAKEAAAAHPRAYQHVLVHVKPGRAKNPDTQRRERWWLFGRSNERMRASIRGLRRFIVTPEVAKHRPFVFVDDPTTVPDAGLYVIGSDDAYVLGVLSARPHLVWALAAGGHLGKGNDPRYQSGPCFDPFPFPEVDETGHYRIREIAEEIDAHRKRSKAQHSTLILTDIYNVLEKLRRQESLTKKEQLVHEAGLVSILLGLHDELDAAVFAAYGWTQDLSNEELRGKLVALNADRASEESRGKVRWLRRDFQKQYMQAREPGFATESAPPPPQLEIPWPEEVADQVIAVHDALLSAERMLTADEIAATFRGASAQRVTPLLEALERKAYAVRQRNGTDRWKGLAKVTGERRGGSRLAS